MPEPQTEGGREYALLSVKLDKVLDVTEQARRELAAMAVRMTDFDERLRRVEMLDLRVTVPHIEEVTKDHEARLRTTERIVNKVAVLGAVATVVVPIVIGLVMELIRRS